MKDMMRGKCWVFGDDIPIDGGIMDLKYLVEQVHDPQELAKHCLERLNSEFPKWPSPMTLWWRARGSDSGTRISKDSSG